MINVKKNRNHYYLNLKSIMSKNLQFSLLFLLFLLNIKQSSSEYLESFYSKKFDKLDSLIEIIDYYNLSIFLTTNKDYI